MSLTIRRLHYRDLAEVVRIERAAFGTPWPAREFAFELAKPTGCCLAAVADEALAGYLVACPQGRLWNLRNVAVAASSRRRGVGSALLRALLENERVAGSNVVLEVRESELGAIALYERFGFYVAGRRPEFYGDNREDAVLMWCSVPLG